METGGGKPLHLHREVQMPRPMNPDLTKNWNTSLPATLAGKVEHLLFDEISCKPRYGARGKLLEELLMFWLDVEEGRIPRPEGNFPSLARIILD